MVAKNLDAVKESVGILITSLALSIPVDLCLLAALVWWLTGRVLRPVEDIRAEVASIRGTELRRRRGLRRARPRRRQPVARAIWNLASNAERHATTTVTFELREHDGHSELVVADDGRGIPAGQREAVSNVSHGWTKPDLRTWAEPDWDWPSCRTSSLGTRAPSPSGRPTGEAPD